MAAIIDETYLRQTFNIHDEVGDERLTPYIKAAHRRLHAWVGDGPFGDDYAADELKLAEATLAMSMLIPNLNTAVRPNGLVRRETVENNVVVEYLSQSEVGTAAAAYLEQASQIVSEWNQLTDVALPSIVESDDTSCEAATRPCP